MLDYDDTYSPGLVHASAPVAPVALLLGAELGVDVGRVLDAYARGFEATAALGRAGHPRCTSRAGTRPPSAEAWGRPWRRRVSWS